jgi:hypothetical protein
MLKEDKCLDAPLILLIPLDVQSNLVGKQGLELGLQLE